MSGLPALLSVPTHAGKTILLLEDEPALMKLLAHALSPYHVIEATTADEALRLFAERGRHVDLLIADVYAASRLGIARGLLSPLRNSNLPVILTSGYPVSSWSDTDTVDLAAAWLNIRGVPPKTFSGSRTMRLVEKLLGTPHRQKMRRLMDRI